MIVNEAIRHIERLQGIMTGKGETGVLIGGLSRIHLTVPDRRRRKVSIMILAMAPVTGIVKSFGVPLMSPHGPFMEQVPRVEGVIIEGMRLTGTGTREAGNSPP